jgi:hypothetical protein
MELLIKLETKQCDNGWVPATFTPGVKWLGQEANHSPQPSAEECIHLHSPIRLHSIVLSFALGQLYLTLQCDN